MGLTFANDGLGDLPPSSIPPSHCSFPFALSLWMLLDLQEMHCVLHCHISSGLCGWGAGRGARGKEPRPAQQRSSMQMKPAADPSLPERASQFITTKSQDGFPENGKERERKVTMQDSPLVLTGLTPSAAGGLPLVVETFSKCTREPPCPPLCADCPGGLSHVQPIVILRFTWTPTLPDCFSLEGDPRAKCTCGHSQTPVSA